MTREPTPSKMGRRRTVLLTAMIGCSLSGLRSFRKFTSRYRFGYRFGSFRSLPVPAGPHLACGEILVQSCLFRCRAPLLLLRNWGRSGIVGGCWRRSASLLAQRTVRFWPETSDVRFLSRVLRGCPVTVSPFWPDFRSNFFLIGMRDDSGAPCRAPTFLNKGPCDTPCSAATLFCKSGLLTRKSPRRRASWPRSPLKAALLSPGSLSGPRPRPVGDIACGELKSFPLSPIQRRNCRPSRSSYYWGVPTKTSLFRILRAFSFERSLKNLRDDFCFKFEFEFEKVCLKDHWDTP